MSPSIATGLFLFGLVLWTIESAPPAYLLVCGIIGVVWFLDVIFIWRFWHFATSVLGMLPFAAGPVVIDKMFSLPNQTQELQGVLLALSVLFSLLYVLRDMVVRLAKLPIAR